MKRVNNALLSLTGLPLLIIDSITHHCPGYAVIEAHSESEEYKSYYINYKLIVLREKREHAKDSCSDKTCDRAYGCDLLLTVLFNELGSKGHKYEHRSKSDRGNNSGHACITEVRSKHDRVSGRSRLHTKEHTHSRDGAAYCGTVLHKRAKGLEEINLFGVFLVKLSVFVAANSNVLNHKDKEYECKHTHNKSCPEHPLAKQVLKLCTGKRAEHLIANLVHLTCLITKENTIVGIMSKVALGKTRALKSGSDFVPEGFSSLCSPGDLVPNKHRKNYTGKHTANRTADRSEHGKLCSLTCVVGNYVKHRAVRNVSHSISRIPNDVSNNEQHRFYNGARIRERKEYSRAAYEQTDRSDKYICLILTHFVFSLVVVDKRADKRVIDSVPSLNDQKKDREKACFQHHVNEPEGLYGRLKTKAQVAACITRSIRELVANAKLRLAACVELSNFCHSVFSSLKSIFFSHL